MTTTTVSGSTPDRSDDLWFDDLVMESPDWVIAQVTTPRGKRVRYRIMIKQPA